MKPLGCAVIAFATAIAMGVVSGCRVQQAFVEPEPGLERMLDQPRVDPFQGSNFYDDGMGMRSPPRGAIPIERTASDPNVADGIDEGIYVAHVPIVVDRARMERGRERFDIFCAACHGVAGEGESVVAENMDQRKPPSLHEDRIRALPDGRIYQVITTGYGLMPTYAAQLSVEDRWAIVAYVRALQLSRRADVATLPPDVRAALEGGAP